MEDTTLKDMKICQNFLYKNFHTCGHYKSIYPYSNQPAKLYGTAKTQKFNNIREIKNRKFKSRPTASQTGTYSYNEVQSISQY